MPDSGSSRSTEPIGESDKESRELMQSVLRSGEQEEDEEVVDLLSSSSSSSSSVCRRREDVDTHVKLELRDNGGDVCVPASTAISGFTSANTVPC